MREIISNLCTYLYMVVGNIVISKIFQNTCKKVVTVLFISTSPFVFLRVSTISREIKIKGRSCAKRINKLCRATLIIDRIELESMDIQSSICLNAKGELRPHLYTHRKHVRCLSVHCKVVSLNH